MPVPLGRAAPAVKISNQNHQRIVSQRLLCSVCEQAKPKKAAPKPKKEKAAPKKKKEEPKEEPEDDPEVGLCCEYCHFKKLLQ